MGMLRHLLALFAAACSVCLSDCSPQSVAASCERHYPRLSREAIVNGSKPYILGGAAQDCTNCKSEHLYSRFCRFDLDRNLSSVLADKDPFMRWTAVGKTENCAADEQERFLARMISLNEWRFLTLTPCDLWQLIRGQTIWFAGDSMTKDLFKAVECFLFEFWDSKTWDEMRHKHREPHRDDVLQLGADAVRPSCVDLPEGTRLCFKRAFDPESLLTESLPWLRKHALPNDTMIFNTGLHGILPEDIRVIASYASNYKHQLPVAYWKDVSSQHFHSKTGEYTGREVLSKGCAPLPSRAKVQNDSGLVPHVTAGWLNDVSLPIMEAANISVIQDEEKTHDLWNYHLHGECTHFCHPSAPQIWVHSLYEALKNHTGDATSVITH